MLGRGLAAEADEALAAARQDAADRPLAVRVLARQSYLEGLAALQGAVAGRGVEAALADANAGAGVPEAAAPGLAAAEVLLASTAESDPSMAAAWSAQTSCRALTGDGARRRSALDQAVAAAEAESAGAGGRERAGVGDEVRLGALYASPHEAREAAPDGGASLAASAEGLMLSAARRGGWALAWAGAGRAALAGGRAADAETSLAEASVRSSADPSVWALLAAASLAAEPTRDADADAAMEPAARCGMSGGRDGAVLDRVAEALRSRGRLPAAERAARLALVGKGRGAGSASIALGRIVLEAGRADEAAAAVAGAAKEEGAAGEAARRLLAEATEAAGR